MHITERAPVLSATSRTDCICIIVFSPKLFSNLTRSSVPRPVLEPVRVRSPPPTPARRIIKLSLQAPAPRAPSRTLKGCGLYGHPRRSATQNMLFGLLPDGTRQPPDSRRHEGE